MPTHGPWWVLSWEKLNKLCEMIGFSILECEELQRANSVDWKGLARYFKEEKQLLPVLNMIAIYCNKWISNVQNHWLQLKSPKKYIKLPQYQLKKLMSEPDLYYCYCCRHYYYHYYSCLDFLNIYYLLLTMHISFWLRVSHITIHINGLIMCIAVHETYRLK